MAKNGVSLFRNNCGTLKNDRGQFVRFGVANPGGSDLIGWTPIIVTQEMVGRRVAIFTALEIKTNKGIVSDEQEQFIKVVNLNGGIAGVARSVSEAQELIEGNYGRVNRVRVE